jgi:hypothetical protein
VNLLQ